MTVCNKSAVSGDKQRYTILCQAFRIP